MNWRFETPEKLTSDNNDGVVYHVAVNKGSEYTLLTHMEWDGDKVMPTISVQQELIDVRNSLLKSMTENRLLFKNPPVLKSLQALASEWGVLVTSTKTIVWGENNNWEKVPDEIESKRATVRLILKAVRISRSNIQVIWGLKVVEIVPDQTIDIDFLGTEADTDVQSVTSLEIEDSGAGIVRLQDLHRKKMEAKQAVREAMRVSRNAKLTAQVTLDEFYEKFDLSDSESDFSDEGESDEEED
jgi:hypothetical protein